MTATEPPEDYRRKLFEAYSSRVDLLDPPRAEKVAWFRDYLAEHYLPRLGQLPRSSRVLDVGCSRGYLLEAFADLGFTDLTGVDLSPTDIAEGRSALPAADLANVSASEFLGAHPGEYDLIVLRAILEHTPKVEVLPLLTLVSAALAARGTAIIDVPNMDWLFAGHERYMDFTHEVGFTQESLKQVMSTAFAEVTVAAADHLPGSTRDGWRNRLGRAVLGRLLSWADPQGGAGPVWARNLIGVGRRAG